MIKLKRIPNAQKWSEERVIINLIEVEKMAMGDEVLYLGRALIRQGLYANIWGYWKRIFADHDNIMEAMMRIETIFESKLFEGALRKELSPWVAIFGLKHNHKWNEINTDVDELPEPKARRPITVDLGNEIQVLP